MNFCPIFQICGCSWVKFGIRDLHIMPLEYFFTETRHREGCTFMGVNEVTSRPYTMKPREERRGKDYAIRSGVDHLQYCYF
jgi:hypothetical protein